MNMNKLLFFKKPPFRFSKQMYFIRDFFSLTPREKLVEEALGNLKRCYKDINYLEFGVYEGGMVSSVYHLAKYLDVNVNIYAFDSFEGLPKSDYNNDPSLAEGKLKCTYENYLYNLLRNKVDIKKVHTTRGFFKDTLTPFLKSKIKKANFIYIDCDIYESTKECLDFITGLIKEEGTIIIFDDWNLYLFDENNGHRKAFREWKNKNKNIICTRFLTDNSFVLRVVK